MADTRCANSEYQLDVDIMMMEYTVYHAVKAKLEVLQGSTVQGFETGESRRETANMLVQSFDTLLRLFKNHHPAAKISEGATFNIKILEFLVLFDRMSQSELCDTFTLEERGYRSYYSTAWLSEWTPSTDDHRGRHIRERTSSDCKDIPEPVTYTLNDTLFRFLDLSAEVSYAIGSVNEPWYKLAAEYMLQCALERAETLGDVEDSYEDCQRHCSECFTWGVLSPDLRTLFREDMSQRHQKLCHAYSSVCMMFRDNNASHGGHSGSHKDDDGDINMTGNGPAAVVENPLWTRLRNKHHYIITEMLQSIQDGPITSSEAVNKVQTRFPLRDFLANLFGFIEGLWCLNMGGEINGKPVLVQIEEGGIKGVTDQEFRALLDRVGLKTNPTRQGGNKNSVVKWTR